jgi:hypothetical protein
MLNIKPNSKAVELSARACGDLLARSLGLRLERQ